MFILTGPESTLKTLTSFSVSKKNMLAFKGGGRRVGFEVRGQIHFESKFSSFCNLFLVWPLPSSPATIQLKLRLNWQQLLRRLAAR